MLGLPLAPAGDVQACTVCGNRELYKKKDFPHWFGLGILTVACLSFFALNLFYHQWLAWAILIASAVLDGALYVWVGDVVSANLLALDDRRTDYQVFNVGGDQRLTVLELFDLCRRECEVDITSTIPGMYRCGDTRHMFSDVSALKRLGWRTTRDQARVIRSYIEWARQQPEIPDTYGAAEQRMQATGVLRRTEAS